MLNIKMEYNHRVGQCYDDKHVYHSTNASKYTLVFLKYVINEHVFMNLLSLGIEFNHLDIGNT